jgi:hypothetical protein
VNSETSDSDNSFNISMFAGSIQCFTMGIAA